MSLLLLAILSTTATTSIATDMLVLPLGVTREFVCTSPGPGYTIAWGVNDLPAANSQFQAYIVLGEEVDFGDDGIQRNLTFTADARANNTHILCRANHLNTGESMVRVDMNLIIQGSVSPPDVTYEVSSDHHSVVFSWSAPFTLNISDMEPDILHYVVYIIRDDGHNDTVNTTDTHYELQADPCQSHQYHVEIAAVNVVGEGEKYISEVPLEGYAVAEVPAIAISFNGRMALIEITFGATPPQCREMHFQVIFAAVYSQDRLLFNSNGSTLSLNASDNSLKTNELYNLVVYIEGLPNSKSKSMNISTFDVQTVTTAIHYDDQLSDYVVDITCYFAEGSDAKGCRIVTHPQPVKDNIKSCEFVATREGRNESTVTVALPNGIHTLMIYDDEEGAARYPAFSITLSVDNSQHISECATVPNDSKLYSTTVNNAVVTVAAATGGVLLFIVTSFMCVAVSIILIRRERKKAAIVLAPNIAYEEVKLKKKKRRTAPSHGQPVVTLSQDQ